MNDDRQIFVAEVFVEDVAELRLRPNQVDPHGQSLAGKDSSADLCLGSFVGAYSVKRDVDEHGLLEHGVLERLLGFLDFEDGAALVLAALGAGAMGQLLLVAGGAFRDPNGGQKVV
jgi:hypothetical protein